MRKTPGTFEITHRDAASGARCGRLHTAHGVVETPVFMPVGTQATVKSMTPHEIADFGYSILLGNTYHLGERPGVETIERLGGLHRFMGWDRAILTDSGGYQVFSLSDLRRIEADGVRFKSHVDGSHRFMGPVESMRIQRGLASDIAMVFDECPPYPCERDYACKAVERTLAWATLCAEQPRAANQLVFGIVQGGIYPELREQCARALLRIGFDGYAIGGVSVGEPDALILPSVRNTIVHLPEEQPRYLMGVGVLPQMLEAIALGVDMFDCVMPTRFARNGTVFTRMGRYPVKSAVYREDDRPLEEGCTCYACRHFSRAYVRHLCRVNEILGARLITLHNLHVYATCLQEVREAIQENGYDAYRKNFIQSYRTIRRDHVVPKK